DIGIQLAGEAPLPYSSRKDAKFGELATPVTWTGPEMDWPGVGEKMTAGKAGAAPGPKVGVVPKPGTLPTAPAGLTSVGARGSPSEFAQSWAARLSSSVLSWSGGKTSITRCSTYCG